MVASREGICNLAIAKVKAKPIVSFDEDSLEARECRRFYPEVVQAMLEGPEDWHFATQRVLLASKVTDRENEWVYAYQAPSNMAQAIKVLPDLDAFGLGLPIPLPGEPYAETWSSIGFDMSVPYEIVGDTIYVNAETATLEYLVNDVAGLNLPHLVGQALALELGAHLAVPLKGDSKREAELLQQASTAWERAIAENRNRQATQYPTHISETLAARHGYYGG